MSNLSNPPRNFYTHKVDKFSFIEEPSRRIYHAMVNYLDTLLGSVVDMLKHKGMWEQTLVVVFSDNGGPVYFNGEAGANN